MKQVDQTIKEEEGRVMPPLQISLDEAWAEGFIKGVREGALHSVALKMMEKKMDPALISEMTELSWEEIKKLKSYCKNNKS